jgi:hypothetical protein
MSVRYGAGKHDITSIQTKRLKMGGRYWNYFVPYAEDAGAALQKLRAETFRSGQYTDSRTVLSPQELEEDPELAEEVQRLKKPHTIEELLEQEQESGTNSIVDITHVSETREFCAVTPMPAQDLQDLFGTDKPTHEMVESKRYLELAEHRLTCEKWMGAYFTVYRDGKPDEIFFAGVSGDH